jgi:transposase
MAKEGPGCYLPDETEGIDRIEDLPKPRIEKRNRSRRKCPCPGCGHASTRKHVRQRQLHDLGDARAGCPIELRVSYSEHYCCKCDRWFTVDLSDLAAPASHYTHRVVAAAVMAVIEDGLPYRTASWHLWRDHRVFVPFATIQNWIEAAGKKR